MYLILKMLIMKKLLDVLLVTSTLNIVLEWCNYEQNKLAFDAFFTLHLYLCFQCSVTNRISFKHLKKFQDIDFSYDVMIVN